MKRFNPLRRIACATAIALCATPLHAQPAGASPAAAWPSQTVRLIAPFAPGQAADTLARLLAEHFSKAFGKPFVVENKVGAGGILGTEAAARSAPDGHTLVVSSSGPFIVSPAVYEKLRYDVIRDFEPIANVALTPQMLLVSASSPIRSVKDLVEQAKAKPGDTSFGSSGIGSTSHLAMEMFRSAAGVQVNHVPFKGSQDAATQIIGGSIVAMFDTVPGSLALVRAGKLRALAVAAPARSPFLPDVPTLAEAGMRGVEAIGWIGLSAPAGTPAAILDRLNAEIRRMLATPEVKERFAALAFVPVGDTRQEFLGFIRAELARWGKAAKDAGVKLE